MAPDQALVCEEDAAYFAGCPGKTIRRWAAEGRISRYGAKPGRVLYDALELPKAVRDEVTHEVIYRPAPPPLPHNRQAAA